MASRACCSAACSFGAEGVVTPEAQAAPKRGGAKDMTDPARRARDLNEAARHFAETLADSYRLVYGQAAESAERQQERAQEFSALVSSNLREQTEAGRSNAQELSEQAARQQEAGQQFARE